MNNVYDLDYYRKKFNPKIVQVGDIIEWTDWNNEAFKFKVSRIEKNGREISSISIENINTLTIFFNAKGFSISGMVFTRKVLKRAS